MPIPITTPVDQPEADFLQNTIGVQFHIQRFGELAGGLASLIFIASLLAIFLCILLSGIQWLTSQADKAKLQAARSRITNCLIGLALVSMTLAFLILIQAFFGIQILATP